MKVNIINRINGWFGNNYGSRRGYAKTIWYRAYYLSGGYRSYERIDWCSVERLVYVCKGNICRSAYAEAVTKLLGIDSVSCGVDTRSNWPANERAIKVAGVKGVDLKEHRTTPIELLEVFDGDLFVAMEPWHAEFIRQKYGEKYQNSLLGLWQRPISPHIQDPYGAPELYFDYCFNYIEKSVHEITRKISKAKES